MAINPSCIVIFSGGQDSTTCVLWALKKFKNVIALTFDYKQRHKIELDCAKNIINILNDKEKHQIDWLSENQILEQKIVDISFLSDLLKTAMIQDLEIEYDFSQKQ